MAKRTTETPAPTYPPVVGAFYMLRLDEDGQDSNRVYLVQKIARKWIYLYQFSYLQQHRLKNTLEAWNCTKPRPMPHIDPANVRHHAVLRVAEWERFGYQFSEKNAWAAIDMLPRTTPQFVLEADKQAADLIS